MSSIALHLQGNLQTSVHVRYKHVRSLCKRGWPLEKCMSVYKFLDAALGLNKNFEVEYIQQVKRIEKEYNMTYVLTAERHGIQKGEAGLLMRLLQAKFDTLPETYVEKIKNADSNTLSQWGINFVKAESLDDIFVA